ncbi:TPA: DUF5986 family protein [Streptococcus pyogenes]
MKKLKEIIANVIVEALEQDFLDCKYKLNLDTHNCFGGLKSDVINTKLREVLTSENYIIHKFKRYAWEGRFILDLESKSLVSITSISNLNRIPKDKNRRVPHYMQSILYYLNSEIDTNKQISFDLGKTFNPDVYEQDFKNIFSGLDINLSDFTYYVVAYDYKANKINEMDWYLLGNEFNIAKKESIMNLINPDFINLTRLENDFSDELTEIAENKPNKGIKLGLKEKNVKKHG